MMDYEQRQSPEFREKFGRLQADVEYMKESIQEMRTLLKKHIEEDVPVDSWLSKKLLVILSAVIMAIASGILTYISNRAMMAAESITFSRYESSGYPQSDGRGRPK